MDNPPRFKIGDTIYWYCDKEQRTHHAKVDFVNYVHIGNFYDDINYEVEVECCGERKTMFIDESDAFGFDIQSVNKDKTPRYIEVKATQRKVGDMDFYYTENEYETAKKYGKDYYIYVVFEILTPHPKVWVIKNPFEDGEGVKMKPVKYKVQLSTIKK